MLKKLVSSFSRYIVSVQFRDHQLLGHFVPHILYRGSAPEPHWAISIFFSAHDDDSDDVLSRLVHSK